MELSLCRVFLLLTILVLAVNSQGNGNGNNGNGNGNNGNGNGNNGNGNDNTGNGNDDGQTSTATLCSAGRTAFNGKCYWMEADGDTFENSREACRGSGGHLARFRDNNHVEAAATALASLVGTAKFWIGMRYIGNQWEWLGGDNTQNQMGNQNWAQHEKTQFNEGEQCVTAKKEPGENDWKYYSDACTSNNFRPLCVSNGRQSCDDMTCPSNSRCVDGDRNSRCECNPGFTQNRKGATMTCQSSNLCQASGDPHYRTWDGVRRHYQGMCRHLLAGVCGDNIPADLEVWEVTVNNIRRADRSDTVAFTQYAEVSVYGYVIRLGLGGAVTVDGVSRTPTISLNNGAIEIFFSARQHLVLNTDFGLMVKFKSYKVNINAPGNYANRMCGICGDWDGNRANDADADLSTFQEPEFVGVVGCDIPDDDIIDECDDLVKADANVACNLMDNLNEFSTCASNLIDRAEYKTDCLEDICGGGDPLDIVCDTLDSLAGACEDVGTPIATTYRAQSGCGLDCPAHSVYNPEMDLDVPTCDNPTAEYDVSLGVGEGCECSSGYIMSGTDCVPETECGCLLISAEPVYIMRGDSFTDAECQTMWTCDGSGTARPDHIGGCEEGASCVPRQSGGAYECECDDGVTRNGDNCERITHCTVTVDGVEITLQSGDTRLDHECRRASCTDGVKDIVDSECADDADCVDNNGIYECLCPDGYSGDPTVECEDEEVNGDPHFLIASRDHLNTHLCFDINGRDGDVLKLVRDPDNDLEVNGQMFETKSTNFKQTFFSGIAIMYGEFKIVATLDNITVNNYHAIKWTDSYSIDIGEDISIQSPNRYTVSIELSPDLKMKVTRAKTLANQYYLGFFITRSGGISSNADGVMGKFVRSSFMAISEPGSFDIGVVTFSQLPISIPVQRVKRFSRSHGGQIDCWFYKVDTEAFSDGLLGSRTSYTVPTLQHFDNILVDVQALDDM